MKVAGSNLAPLIYDEKLSICGRSLEGERGEDSLGGYSGGSKVSEFVRGVLVLLIAWAIIALGVLASEGTSLASSAFVLAGVLILTACLFLLVRPRT